MLVLASAMAVVTGYGLSRPELRHAVWPAVGHEAGLPEEAGQRAWLGEATRPFGKNGCEFHQPGRQRRRRPVPWVRLHQQSRPVSKAGAGQLAQTVTEAMCSAFGHWCNVSLPVWG